MNRNYFTPIIIAVSLVFGMVVACAPANSNDDQYINSVVETRVANEFAEATRIAEEKISLRATIEAEYQATAEAGQLPEQMMPSPTVRVTEIPALVATPFPNTTETAISNATAIAYYVMGTTTALAVEENATATANALTQIANPTSTATATFLPASPTTITPPLEESNPLIPDVEFGFRPGGAPFRIAINSDGEVSFGLVGEFPTQIGVFDLSVTWTLFDIENFLKPSNSNPNTHFLYIRVDDNLRVYEVTNGQAFSIEFEDAQTAYQQVGLEYRSNGDVILELESIDQSTTPLGENCSNAPGETFEYFWYSNRSVIGCPVTSQRSINTIAEQLYEGGHLFWRKDTNEVYAIYDRLKEGGETNSGFWETDPQWNWGAAGEPDPDGIGLVPPVGRFEPKRGFGWLWRTYLGRESGVLGWALDREYGFDEKAQIQYFDQGIMFKGSSPKLYILLYDGRFFASGG